MIGRERTKESLGTSFRVRPVASSDFIVRHGPCSFQCGRKFLVFGLAGDCPKIQKRHSRRYRLNAKIGASGCHLCPRKEKRNRIIGLICPFCPRVLLLSVHLSGRWMVGAVGKESGCAGQPLYPSRSSGHGNPRSRLMCVCCIENISYMPRLWISISGAAPLLACKASVFFDLFSYTTSEAH